MERHAAHVLDLYTKAYPHAFVQHNLASFDDFLDRFVPDYFRRTASPLLHTASQKRDIRVWFGGRDGKGFRVLPPRNEDGTPMMPNDARLQDRTYAATILMDIDIEYDYTARNGEAKTASVRIEDHVYGRIPIPLFSRYCNLRDKDDTERYAAGECKNEPGGYFIVDGGERFLRSQEGLGTGIVNAYHAKPDEVRWLATAEVRSGDVSIPSFGHFVHVARTKDAKPAASNFGPDSDEQPNVDPDLLSTVRRGGLWFESNAFLEPVPLCIVMRALGATSDQAIADLILGPDLAAKQFHNIVADALQLRNLPNGVSIFTPAQAMAWLKTKTKAQGEFALMDTLRRLLLPHLGTNLERKLVFLGYMARQALGLVVNNEQPTDRDHTRFKRLDCAGDLCASLFQKIAGRQLDDFIREVDKRLRYDAKRYEDSAVVDLLTPETLPTAYMPSHVLEDAFARSFKGTWDGQSGVSQILNRLNYNWTMCDLRRCRLRIGDGVKEREPRVLHMSQFGFFCPIESPDGPELGLVKSLATLAVPSIAVPSETVLDVLDRNVKFFRSLEAPRAEADLTVFLNGAIVGYASPPDDFHARLLELRRSGVLDKHVSLSWRRELGVYNIFSDAGRLCRALYRLDQSTLLDEADILACRSFAELESKYIDWVDAEESDTLMISMTPAVSPHVDSLPTAAPELVPTFTHSEIHGSFMLGLAAAMIPFSQHNPGTRNAFAVGQNRQGIGVYHTNWQKRFDQTAVVMPFAERPLVSTHMHGLFGSGQMHNGQNALCAVMTYGGYNQEDSVLLNAGALKRGLFLTTKFQVVKYTEEVVDSASQTFITHPTKGKLSGYITALAGNDLEALDDDGIIKPHTLLKANTVLVGVAKPDVQGQWRDASLTAGVHLENFYVDAVYKYSVWTRGRFVQGVKVRVRQLRVPILGDKMSIASCANKGTVGQIIAEQDMPFTSSGMRPDIIMNPHSLPTRMTMSVTHEMVAGKAGLLGGYITDVTAFAPRVDALEVAGERLAKAGYEPHGEELLYNGRTGELMSSVFLCPVYYMRLKQMVDDKWFSRATGPRTRLTRQPVAGRAHEGGLRIGEMERDSIIAHGAAGVLRDALMDRSDGEITLLHRSRGTLETALDDQEPTTIEITHATRLFLQEVQSMHIDMRLVPA